MWFLALAAIGVLNISGNPEVLQALNPWWGLRFFIEHGWHGIFILGAVVLAVTGGEALYADMGHFGRRPIQYAWNFLVLPALTINYLGQGALLLANPEAVKNPVLHRRAGVGALSDGRAGDGGHRHRVAGGDQRRLLGDAAGDPARLPAAHGDPAHVARDDRPDLHSVDQLAADARR